MERMDIRFNRQQLEFILHVMEYGVLPNGINDERFEAIEKALTGEVKETIRLRFEEI